MNVLVDVTGRVAAEQVTQRLLAEITVQQQRVDNVIANVPGVVFEVHGAPGAPDQRIEFVSEYSEQMLGYASEAWIEDPTLWHRIIHPDDQERALAEAKAIWDNGQGGTTQYRVYAKSGRLLWLEAQTSVIRDASGKQIGRRGVITDISERKAVEERQRFLAEVREVLSSSLDYPVTMDRFARHCVPYLADWCTIDVLDDDDSIRRVTVYHFDPAKLELTRRLQEKYAPIYDKERGGIALVIRSGKSELYTEVPDSVLAETAQDDEHLQIMRELGLSSVVIVPLILRRKVFGAITLVSSESGRRYGPDDLALAEELGKRVGIYLDNARMHQSAIQSEERQRFLADVSAILFSSRDYRATLNTLARQLTGHLADLCSIDMVEDGKVRRVALAHVDPAKEKMLTRRQPTYEPDPKGAHPIMQVVRTGRSQLVNDLQDSTLVASARDNQHLNDLRSLGVNSVIVVPLPVGGKRSGAITLVQAESGRKYDEADLVFAEEVAHRAGIAIDNARAYEAEQGARGTAEHAVDRVTRLQELTASLSQAMTEAEVGAIVVNAAMSTLKASSSLVVLIANDSKLQMVAGDGLSREFSRSWQAFADRPPEAIVSAITRGEPVFAASSAELLNSFPDLSQIGMAEGRSFACLPLVTESRTIGCVVLTFEGWRVLEDEDREFVLALSAQCALAMERARLYEAESVARHEAEQAQARLWFLAEASAVLAASLDSETIMNRVARMVIPFLADCCSVIVFPAGDTPARTAVAHVDPAKEELMQRLHSEFAPPPDNHPIITMVKTEASVLLPEIDDEALKSIASTKAHLKALRQLAFTSYMAIPMIARARLIGAITFAFARPGKRYDKTHLALAEELARRAALALDNAALYEESRNIQEALRAALESKDEFLGLMSHELRTPITAIYGGSRMLRVRGTRLKNDNREIILSDIEQESERLFRMVENLLVLSRLELGQEVPTEPVLAQRITEKAAAQFTGQPAIA